MRMAHHALTQTQGRAVRSLWVVPASQAAFVHRARDSTSWSVHAAVPRRTVAQQSPQPITGITRQELVASLESEDVVLLDVRAPMASSCPPSPRRSQMSLAFSRFR